MRPRRQGVDGCDNAICRIYAAQFSLNTTGRGISMLALCLLMTLYHSVLPIPIASSQELLRPIHISSWSSVLIYANRCHTILYQGCFYVKNLVDGSVIAQFLSCSCNLLGSVRENWLVNTLRPRQNGRHSADDIFKCIFLNENVWIPIKIHWNLFLRVELTIFQHWFR